MADGYLGYESPTTENKKLDTEQLTVGSNTVQRERIQVTGTGATDIAPVSATNGLSVDVKAIAAGTNAIGKVGHDHTGIGDGRQTVSTGGTAVALAASTACKKVIICAEQDNTGVIVVGGSTVVAALGTRRGTPLFPSDTIEIQIDNLNDIYIDTTVNGDGVTYTYFT